MSLDAAVPIPITRPSLSLLGTEPLRAAYEFLSHKLSSSKALPGGDGHPVVLFPGLASDGRALAPLRQHCESMGFHAMDWGRGFNTGPKGDVDAWIGELADHTEELIRPFAGRATFIGWSLGGFYARELAKVLKSRVRQVITLGTPFNDGSDHTNVSWVFRLLNGQRPLVNSALIRRLRKPPAVPTTSIYSRSDGIVAWQTCCHQATRSRVQDIEVPGSHIGMGWNPAVIRLISDLLIEHSDGGPSRARLTRRAA